MLKRTRLIPFALPLLLAACATVPDGPSIMALPGTGKAPQQFNSDEAYCRQIALQQSGGSSANQNAVDSQVRSATLGTLLGAAAGAMMGENHSAGVGAGTGLVFGALAGADAADRAAYTTQQRYDVSYAQCMYDMGHRVPVSGRLIVERSRSIPPPPPMRTMPPPPMSSTPPAATLGEQLFVYPKGGQSDAQIAEDRRQCSAWASTQTGFDPAKDAPADPRHGDFKRATAACLESHGYSVK
jgi:outer membrane lipoprotein SlyB